MRDKTDLARVFDGFSETWSPRIVARVNDMEVMAVKASDAFVWHSHPDTDHFFLVLEGELDIELRDRTVSLSPGQIFVVPKGVEHRPLVRRGEARLLIIEPAGTPNTGDPRTAAIKVEV